MLRLFFVRICGGNPPNMVDASGKGTAFLLVLKPAYDADVKRTAEKLEKAHPDSESIKYGFTIALMG